MRLPEKMVDHLCQRILEHLKTKQLIVIKVPEPQVLKRMREAFLEDLSTESKLDQEARKLLEKFRPQIDRGEIDEQKMFQMIKKQIIKDKKLVI